MEIYYLLCKTPVIILHSCIPVELATIGSLPSTLNTFVTLYCIIIIIPNFPLFIFTVTPSALIVQLCVVSDHCGITFDRLHEC